VQHLAGAEYSLSMFASKIHFQMLVQMQSPDLVTLTIGYHKLEGKRVPLVSCSWGAQHSQHGILFCFSLLTGPSSLFRLSLQKKPFAIMEQVKEAHSQPVQQSEAESRDAGISDQMQIDDGAPAAKQPQGYSNVRYEVGGLMKGVPHGSQRG
jgi:hypothetical protein